MRVGFVTCEPPSHASFSLALGLCDVCFKVLGACCSPCKATDTRASNSSAVPVTRDSLATCPGHVKQLALQNCGSTRRTGAAQSQPMRRVRAGLCGFSEPQPRSDLLLAMPQMPTAKVVSHKSRSANTWTAGNEDLICLHGVNRTWQKPTSRLAAGHRRTLAAASGRPGNAYRATCSDLVKLEL